MPPKNKVYTLPEPIRAWLDETLAANGGQQFAALEAQLAAKGFKISDSALQRYHAGDLAPRLQALKLATESARTVVAAMGEKDGSNMLEAMTALCQERLFSLLMAANQNNLDGGMMAKLTRAISELAKASIHVKKHVADARAKALEEAAAIVEETATQRGYSVEEAEFWRNKVLGVQGVTKA